jgi:hypothetical protein
VQTKVDLDLVRERLSQLTERGRALTESRYRSEVSHQEFVDAGEFREWRVGCIAFLREALGADSPYTKEFEFNCDSPYLSAVARGQAVLRAAREYIDFGPVARVEELVAAEIFTDLLGIAGRMLRDGHLGVAVALAAAVLEDVMRRSARHRRIAIRENVDDLAVLNIKLAQAGVYPPAIANRIEAWAALRRSAEAGVLNSSGASEVEGMLRGVRDFVNDHLV